MLSTNGRNVAPFQVGSNRLQFLSVHLHGGTCMAAYSFGFASHKRVKALVLGFMLCVLLLGLSLAPAGSKVAQATECRGNAVWAGQRGWDSFTNPNYRVEFRFDSGRTSYYAIYYNGAYLADKNNTSIIGPRDFANGITSFGLSTRWALTHPGWTNTSKWLVKWVCY